MLSPGKHHELIPYDLLPNLAFRHKLLKACEEQPDYRLAARRMCAEDVLFFVWAFGWQFNPKDKEGMKGKVGPFVPWPIHKTAFLKLVWCIENEEDCLIEKSRQMGASWMLVFLFVWLLLFHDHATLQFISRDEKMVDSPKPSSLFWKVRFIMRHLPKWLLPKQLVDQKLFFKNEDIESTVFGEATTGSAAVGATLLAMGIDEFSKIKDDFEVYHNTADSTNCRIFNGTHEGINSCLFKLSQSPDIQKLVLHWTMHPKRVKGLYRSGAVPEILDKTYDFPPDYKFVTDGTPSGGYAPGIRSVWYDRQCIRAGSGRAVAMNLDIDPQGSTSQFFDVIRLRELTPYCRPHVWEGDVAYDRDSGVPVGLAERPGGFLKLWVRPDAKGMLPKSAYFIGGDISNGAGATPTCLSIFDALGGESSSGEKIGEYRNGRIEPGPMGVYMVALGRWLIGEDDREAGLIWEIPGPGVTMGKVILELGYRHIYYREEDVTDKRLTNNAASVKPGWHSNFKTKRNLLEEYRDALSMRLFANYSEAALKECYDFEYDARGNVVHGREKSKDDPSGANENHGDQVMADAMVWRMARRIKRKMKEREKKEPAVLSWEWRRRFEEQQRQTAGSWLG